MVRRKKSTRISHAKKNAISNLSERTLITDIPVEVKTVEIEQETPKSATLSDIAGRPHPKRRIPVGSKNVMNVPQIPGYKTRWVNDVREGQRMTTFTDAGYEFVMKGETDTSGLSIQAGADTPVGTPISKNVGGGVKAFLMKQREEFYNEDQQAKQRNIDQLENSIRRKRTRPEDATPEDGQYGEVTVGNKISM